MRVTKAMLACMGALPADAVARVQLGDGVGPSDDEILVMGLLNAAMVSMRDDLIELKVKFADDWVAYGEHLKERHSKPHFCTFGLKSTAMQLRIYSPKPKMSTNATIPPICGNSKLMPNTEDRSLPHESIRRRVPRGLERSPGNG
ncbi:hypothetical protein B0H16DRAFT_1460751 [Mycena metata]|uniref:Uncharacterized protein n=1 Tax=Mycena metata TaxID=1033252 RepID=A0AAD7IWL8_9AGAR|nr:hypothetical protein B0H16DRAFT_1460751 [Mycena metata]